MNTDIYYKMWNWLQLKHNPDAMQNGKSASVTVGIKVWSSDVNFYKNAYTVIQKTPTQTVGHTSVKYLYLISNFFTDTLSRELILTLIFCVFIVHFGVFFIVIGSLINAITNCFLVNLSIKVGNYFENWSIFDRVYNKNSIVGVFWLTV